MPKYTVQFLRDYWDFRTVTVRAKSETEAKTKVRKRHRGATGCKVVSTHHTPTN